MKYPIADDPYTVVQTNKKFQWFKQPVNQFSSYNVIKKAVKYIRQLDCTEDDELITDLNEKIGQCKSWLAHFQVGDLKKILMNFFTEVNKNYIKHLLGMFNPSATRLRWKNITVDDEVYLHEHHKNYGKTTKIKIPFYICLPLEIEPICKYLRMNPSKFDIFKVRPYASYLQWVSAMESAFSIFMDSDGAVHCHREQQHPNGKFYNRRSIFTKTTKHWTVRYQYWIYRNAKASFGVQCLHSIFQSGMFTLFLIFMIFQHYWMIIMYTR